MTKHTLSELKELADTPASKIDYVRHSPNFWGVVVSQNEWDFLVKSREAIPLLTEEVRLLRKALIDISRANYAGPSTDERREWSWATAEKVLDLSKERLPD